ncbi:glycosyltransferase family 2 protein [Parahaliea mediterranea]|uniref:Glycosyltransferase family 2 protein n=1 Tax=Parahaliea mediterranea TaxID=651086 RepID=A0A939IJM2_9GAMM|nr:glycosyltransferase family 2 protein [Parahaliea mediterranea]MBN7796441.1 glycosyltransferase family 2 protein [Parahaliea mediterranea]
MHDTAGDLVSVVVPVYNELAVLPAFYQRLDSALAEIAERAEILFVDDGSSDGGGAWLLALRERDPRVTVLELSRNYGKEVAVSAGLDHAAGDAVVLVDADLQDPPEMLPQFIAAWREGYDVVYGQRLSRAGESWLKVQSARLFYRVINRLSDVPIPRDAGDFRLLSRRAVDAVAELRESHRYMTGLFAWVGFPSKALPYARQPRQAGRSKWNYWRLWTLALEGITSFSAVPLKLATGLGVLTAGAALLYGLFMLVRTLLFGNPVPGYPSLIVVMLFLGGVQLICLGIIGEYLGRTYDETKRRPLYFLRGLHPRRGGPGA